MSRCGTRDGREHETGELSIGQLVENRAEVDALLPPSRAKTDIVRYERQAAPVSSRPQNKAGRCEATPLPGVQDFAAIRDDRIYVPHVVSSSATLAKEAVWRE